MGTASTAARPLGSASLGSPDGAAMSWWRDTGARSVHGKLHMPVEQHRHVILILAATMFRSMCFAMLLCQAQAMRSQGPSRPAERPRSALSRSWITRPM